MLEGGERMWCESEIGKVEREEIKWCVSWRREKLMFKGRREKVKVEREDRM